MRHLPRIDREFFSIAEAVRVHQDNLGRASSVLRATNLTRIPGPDLMDQARHIEEVRQMLRVNPVLKRIVES